MANGIIDRSYYAAAEQGRQDRAREQTNMLAQQGASQELQYNSLRQKALQQDMDAQAQGSRDAEAKQFATQMLAASEYADRSPNPKAFIQQNFPQLVEKYGPEWATASDDEVRQQLQGFKAQFGAQIGQGPPVPPGVSGAMYKFVGDDGKPRFGSAEDVRGRTPYREYQQAPAVSYSPVQTDNGVGAFNSRTGSVTPTGVKPPEATKPLTESDKKARVLLASLKNSEADIAKIGDIDTGNITQRLLGSNQITAPLQSDTYRKYESAGLRWAANLLYLKSGATATPDETRSTWKQFFPQPGDGPDAKAQKASARAQEVSAIESVYQPGGSPVAAPQQQAPAAAIEHLKAHPELAPQFKAKYGYLPGG